MSVRIMSLVWERAQYAGGALLVFLALADWSNDEGVSWPSIEKIGRKTRLERRSIQYIIRQLQKDGMIEIDEGRGRGHQHRYIIKAQNLRLLPTVLDDDRQSQEKVQLLAPIAETKSAIHAKQKAQSTTQTMQSMTEKVQPIAPDPLVEQLEDPSVEPSIGPPYVGNSFLDALKSFKQHRKAMKKPLTLEAERLLYRKLARSSEETATTMLENAVIGRWQGVFEPKENLNGTGTNRPNGYQTNAQRRANQLERYAEIVEELREEDSGGTDEVLRRKQLTS